MVDAAAARCLKAVTLHQQHCSSVHPSSKGISRGMVQAVRRQYADSRPHIEAAASSTTTPTSPPS